MWLRYRVLEGLLMSWAGRTVGSNKHLRSMETVYQRLSTPHTSISSKGCPPSPGVSTRIHTCHSEEHGLWGRVWTYRSPVISWLCWAPPCLSFVVCTVRVTTPWSSHIEKEGGLSVIRYEKSLAWWLAHRENSVNPSDCYYYFLLFFTNAAPSKWPNLFFHGWNLSGLILKNLEYQGLTNVLRYFTSLYGSHLWQDQYDINCHKAKQSDPTNDHESRDTTEKGHKGKEIEGNRSEGECEVGSPPHKLWESRISIENKLHKKIKNKKKIDGCLQGLFKFPIHISRQIWCTFMVSKRNTLFHVLLCYAFFIENAISNPISVFGVPIGLQRLFLEFTILGNIFAVEELLRSPDSLGAPLAKRDFFINATFAFPFSLIFLLYMYFFLELTIMTWDSERVYRFSMPRLILLQYIRWAEGTDWCIERSSGTVFNPCWLDFPRLFF